MYLSSRHREHLQEGLLLLQFCSDFWEQDSTLIFKEASGNIRICSCWHVLQKSVTWASLLRMTVSLEVAVDTIVDAALPMIIMNAIGMIVFISNFNGVFIFQDLESSRQIQKMSVLSQKCLPLLQDGGLNKAENMKKLSDIILKETQWSGILFTDREKVIQWQCKAKDEQAIFYQAKYGDPIPEICRQAMEEGKLVKYEAQTGEKKWIHTAQDYSISSVPFRVKNQSVGSLTVG